MKNKSRSSVLKKEIIDKSARYFLTNNQSVKNENIDLMFEAQPSLMTFFKLLDEGHENEANKEIIMQILAIVFIALRFQKIKLKKIRFSKISSLLEKNATMKRYFNSDKFDFDENGFNEFWKTYKQKNILSYTYFAVNNQYIKEIKEERDAIFIFYTIKTITDVISDSIK